MRFTDTCRASETPAIIAATGKRAAALLALLVLAACSSGPQVPEQAPADAGSKAFNAVLPGGEPTPNPYLTGPHPNVSRDQLRRFNDAKAAMSAGDWPGAEQLLQSLTRDNSSLSGPWVNLGLVWRKLGQDDKAIEAFRRAIAANSANIAAYNHLGLALREAGDFAGALAGYQQALAVWPYDPATHRNIGILYDLYLGDWAEALLHFEAAQQLLPEPSAELTGWIIDTQRRLAARQQETP